jgi:hypothetical protein
LPDHILDHCERSEAIYLWRRFEKARWIASVRCANIAMTNIIGLSPLRASAVFPKLHQLLS